MYITPNSRPTRQQWQADAERTVRTTCHPSQRVAREADQWLTGEELAEARKLARAIAKATRADREIRKDARATEVDELNAGWRTLLTLARVRGAAPEQAARLEELRAAMVQRRDSAGEEAERAAVAAEVQRRASEEGWESEQARRARVERGPQVTTVYARRDGTTEQLGTQPYRH